MSRPTALAGPLLARRAREHNVVYSLAYGDQPALICEMVDWCRAAGFSVVAAGKGTKYLPEYHASTPDTVWPYYGFTPEQVAAGDFNARMFNSFLDGDEERDRDGGRRQRDGPDAVTRRYSPFHRAVSTTCRASCGRQPRAGACITRARSKSSRASSATAVPCFATCAGAST
jgi:hypothetical protein